MAIPHYYAPVGRCIYCGDSRSQLTDEHIIPLGLGGAEILPKASCKTCATITGRFEGTVQRAVYGDFRMHFDLPSRRKKDRPKTHTIGTISGTKIQVPIREVPLTFFVYNFGVCGMLRDMPRSIDVSDFTVATLHDGSKLRAFIKKYDWDAKYQIRFWPNEFRKMIAKIGYAHLTALAGYGEFKPLALRAIRKKHYNMSYLVGQNPVIEPIVGGPWFDMKLRTLHHPNRSSIFVVDIRLFQQNPVPTYHAVVGEVATMAEHDRIMEKIRNSGRVEVP